MFVGLHAMLARAASCPEIEITPDEGAAFMSAAQNVMRHYSVAGTQKTLDWIAFVGVTAGIYSPRIFAITMRRRAGSDGRAGGAYPMPTAGQGDGVAGFTPDPADGYRLAA